jgi:hypothetical protein
VENSGFLGFRVMILALSLYGPPWQGKAMDELVTGIDITLATPLELTTVVRFRVWIWHPCLTVDSA